MKIIVILFTILSLAGCNSCYKTREAAWAACNSKYNGKCYFLGKDYQVCSDSSERNYDSDRRRSLNDGSCESGECDPDYDV